jgi:hypothetical protein
MFIRQTVKILLLIFLLALLTAVTQTGGIVLLCTIGIIFFFSEATFIIVEDILVGHRCVYPVVYDQ